MIGVNCKRAFLSCCSPVHRIACCKSVTLSIPVLKSRIRSIAHVAERAQIGNSSVPRSNTVERALEKTSVLPTSTASPGVRHCFAPLYCCLSNCTAMSSVLNTQTTGCLPCYD